MPVDSLISCNLSDFCTSDKVDWKKATENNIREYKINLNKNLDEINVPVDVLKCDNLFCDSHKAAIEVFHDNIVDACLDAAANSIPLKTPKKGKPGIPGWTQFVEHKRQSSLFWHHLWIDNGRPHTGMVADIMQRTRAQYHLAVKQVKKDKQTHIANCIAKTLDNDKNSFWKNIKKIKQQKQNSIPDRMDDAIGECDISDVFLQKYKNLYTSVNFREDEMKDLQGSVKCDKSQKCVHGECSNGCCNHAINVNEVVSAVKSLRPHKSDGDSRQTSDHLLHGSHKLFFTLPLPFLTKSIYPSCWEYATKI